MATSLANVELPKGTFKDLYSETSIVAGVQMVVQNIGKHDVFLYEKATTPITGGATGYNVIKPGEWMKNVTSNVGSWAMSESGSTLHVEEA